MMAQKIVVVGGGLIGCLLGRMLALRGHRVTIYERRENPNTVAIRGGRSTHLVISERGWRALDAIAASEGVRRHTIPLSGRRIHLESGETVFQPYGQLGQEIHAIHRNELNRLLLELCTSTPGVEMKFKTRCRSIDTKFRKLCVEDEATREINTVSFDRAFAADGAFSTLRSQMLTEKRLDYTQVYEKYGYKELSLPAAVVRQLSPDAMHAWPRGKISLFAFPNRDGSFTATVLAPVDGEIGFNSLRTKPEVSEIFKSRFSDIDLNSVVDEVIANPVSSLFSIRCSPWVFDKRLTLIGDSAHAMVPFLGQGMNAGFEDCTVLADLLEKYNEDFDEALSEFELLRRGNSEAVTEMSSRTFGELTERVGDPSFHVQKQVERTLSRLYPERFTPPYELIAFTHVPYAQVMQKIGELERISQIVLRKSSQITNWESSATDNHVRSVIAQIEREKRHETEAY